MKNQLPENHGLSAKSQEHLLFRSTEGSPSLTDAQYFALGAGVARGESLLVASPTSTGKTQIALWAIARGLESNCRTVYLVTHRALAKQKFDDFKAQIQPHFLLADPKSLVLATGDSVEDATGESPANPLSAPLIVATYEKYLALLSASGIPKDMRNVVVVCDEIQLIGDLSRGQNVEVLLTLLKNTGFRQLVGLSAVLDHKDASDLANWLSASLVYQPEREKHLQYECWLNDTVTYSNTNNPDQIVEKKQKPISNGINSISILKHLLSQNNPPLPIIVFCMRKKDTYDLAMSFAEQLTGGKSGQLSLAFDELPETSANSFLSKIFEHGIASHNADLTDDERHIVERNLAAGKIKVVFATSTLAAGVNFPLGAAIFASWKRWDQDQRSHVPIDPAEFHNMAGRVGRMGFDHEEGRVIFYAESASQLQQARAYLNIGNLPALEPRVRPDRFNQLCLQLISSGLCKDRESVKSLICTTFSALREEDRNLTSFRNWPSQIDLAISKLVSSSFLLETSKGALVATPVGRAVGYSGLLPQTAEYLLSYVVPRAELLTDLLPGSEKKGDIFQFSMLLFIASYSCPEFRAARDDRATRYLPYPLDKVQLFDATPIAHHLPEPVWQADVAPVNSALLTWKWIEGERIRSLESSAPDLTAGTLRELFRNLVWVLQGLASILAAASDKLIPIASRTPIARVNDDALDKLARLPRLIRRFCLRIHEGLPDDCIWMLSLCPPGSDFKLSREEIIALRVRGLSTPERLALGDPTADSIRLQVFSKTKPSPHAKANWIRDSCRDWKSNERKRISKLQLNRAKRCQKPELISSFYGTNGTAFEKAFEDVLVFLGISFERLDDRTKQGAPDYLLKLDNMPPVVVELKSREEGKLIDYNRAVEVLAASEVHGHRSAFCVTLCHPGVDPSVAPVIANCGRLSVVESVDLGEALLRYCEGNLDPEALYQWLSTPGQALISDLPFLSAKHS